MMSDPFTLTLEEMDLAREACRLTRSHWVRITSPDPDRLAIRYLGRRLARVCELARIPTTGLHALRHTFAVNMLRAGVSYR